MFVGNVEIITIGEIYTVVTVYFVFGIQIINHTLLQLVKPCLKRTYLCWMVVNLMTIMSLSVEEKDRLCTMTIFFYIGILRRKKKFV
jgi:hypothetical protein